MLCRMRLFPTRECLRVPGVHQPSRAQVSGRVVAHHGSRVVVMQCPDDDALAAHDALSVPASPLRYSCSLTPK